MNAPVVDPSLLLAGSDLRRIGRRGLERLDRVLSGRWWLAIVVGLALAISLFFAFPSYSGYHPSGEDWEAIQRIGERPFDQDGLDPTDRAYNFTFRVAVPLLGGRLGLTPAGYLALQALGGIGLFAAAAILVERVTGSRRLAALASITTGLMWAGACAFIEIRGNFDAVAIALLVAAMATRKVPLVALCTFLAAWTDERALPIIAFVALFHHVVESRDIRWFTALKEPRVLAAVAGAVLHVATRLVVTVVYDIEQPSNLGLSYVKDQISILPVGAWTGLEGMWLFVAVAGFVLWRIRERLLALAYLGLVGVFLIGTIAVVDVTRSAAYLLPAGFVGVAVMARFCTRNLLRHTTYASFALTAAWPMYYAGGAYTLYWAYPLVLVIVRRLAGIE